MKNQKRLLSLVLSLVLALSLVACDNSTGNVYFWTQNASDIAAYESMETPGGGEGSVESGDEVAIIHAADDGWGGVQSPEIELDLSKDPMLLVQIAENPDEYNWGAKFVPSDPAIEDHEWGFYILEDNNFKHNNYAGADLREKLGEEFIDLYGEQVKGRFWIMAAGGPEATVEVRSMAMFNQK